MRTIKLVKTLKQWTGTIFTLANTQTNDSIVTLSAIDFNREYCRPESHKFDKMIS